MKETITLKLEKKSYHRYNGNRYLWVDVTADAEPTALVGKLSDWWNSRAGDKALFTAATKGTFEKNIEI